MKKWIIATVYGLIAGVLIGTGIDEFMSHRTASGFGYLATSALVLVVFAALHLDWSDDGRDG